MGDDFEKFILFIPMFPLHPRLGMKHTQRYYRNSETFQKADAEK